MFLYVVQHINVGGSGYDYHCHCQNHGNGEGHFGDDRRNNIHALRWRCISF